MFARIALILLCVCVGVITLNIPAAYGAKPRTYQEWIKCRDNVFNSHEPGYYGATGRMATREIRAKCGEPVEKKGSGYVLFKGFCDGIYENSLSECYALGKDYCDQGIDGLSMASQDWVKGLPTKAFNLNNFNGLCKQVCKSRKIPDRQTFGKMMCGES